MILYLEAKKRKITNDTGEPVSLEDAKAAWLAGKVKDCSQSFQRLAACCDFDFDKLDKFYAENP